MEQFTASLKNNSLWYPTHIYSKLAEKAYGKNGIFYDDKHYHKIAKSFIKKSNSPNDQGSSTHPKTEDPFKNFDYNEKI